MKPEILTTKTRTKKSNAARSTTSVTASGMLITENDNEELARFLEELQVSAFLAAKSKDDDFDDDDDDDDFDDDFDDFDDDDLDLDDTDFEEFDMPKPKKSGGAKKKDDDDFELEEDFDDFDDFDDEDDDDDF